ncbi:hypothetical protein CAPTEDRAFT_225105 [Capitella teleta]|uniref:Sushi domain-containing protein n=1 Tax=Capitella teleta TaxID=283909 RepID=R7T9T6_CAPTE|nr:hypothetical protein CAPTEDRAFT_225105 [Capitella teleta]|eukprot:ELT90272.1 hypothetical protein CAPTEDRAFT_225105 [Capitella teleta]
MELQNLSGHSGKRIKCQSGFIRMLESTKGDVLFAILVSITYCSAVVDDAANLAAFSNETDTAVTCELSREAIEERNLIPSLSVGLFSPLSNLTFACNNQSLLIGAPYVICLQHGTWDRPLPICKYVTCPELAIPEDRMQVTLTSPDLIPGTVATYSCREGFVMAEDISSDRKCQTNGEWSSDEPNCIAKCHPMGSIDGGSIHYDCQTEHCPAQVSCSEGYRLHGNRMYICQSNGTWSPETTSNCSRITCELPPTLVHGTLRNNDDDIRLPGSTIKYDCDHGFRMEGNGQLQCTKIGTWPILETRCIYNVSPPAQNTKAVLLTPCGNPESFGNGTFNLRGKTVFFKCNAGFWLDGSDDVTCQSNGQWNSPMPRCIGFYEGGMVVFQLIQLYDDTEKFPDTNWLVKGHLKRTDESWLYKGIIKSTKKEFSRLDMHPLHKALDPTEIAVPGRVNIAALGLGIAIAIVAILLAALLAAVCVRRKGSLSRFGHRTLDTSFENPVYEYEQSMK